MYSNVLQCLALATLVLEAGENIDSALGIRQHFVRFVIVYNA